MLLCDNTPLALAARSSPLSRAQVAEISREIKLYHPHLSFATVWVATKGDRDLATSLKDLDKSDFFTREIDEMLVRGKCRLAIHSAKDLPEPLPAGIKIIAITKGVDPSDVLVFRMGQTLRDLPQQPRIGVSCVRREEAVKKLLPQAQSHDIRGTIGSRLDQLEKGGFDAVVMAEAALIRLGLTHLSRLRLEGSVAPLQGKLAVAARKGDSKMEELFRCIDARSR